MAGHSSEFYFKPEKVDTEEFNQALNNPADGINERVIDDVLSELQTDFEDDGVDKDVLDLLKKLWLVKLHDKQASTPEAGPSKESSVKRSELDVPIPVNLGARPKIFVASSQKPLKKKKITQVDGPNDSSDDDDDERDVDDDDDDDDVSCLELFSAISINPHIFHRSFLKLFL